MLQLYMAIGEGEAVLFTMPDRNRIPPRTGEGVRKQSATPIAAADIGFLLQKDILG